MPTAVVWSAGVVKNVLVTSNLRADCGHKLARKSAWLVFEPKSVVLLRDNLNESSPADP